MFPKKDFRLIITELFWTVQQEKKICNNKILHFVYKNTKWKLQNNLKKIKLFMNKT